MQQQQQLLVALVMLLALLTHASATPPGTQFPTHLARRIKCSHLASASVILLCQPAWQVTASLTEQRCCCQITAVLDGAT